LAVWKNSLIFDVQTLKQKTMSYYKDQLNRVKTDGVYPASFKVTSTEGDTKNMNLNPESVKDLREWLDERFPIEQPKMIKLEEVQDKKSESKWGFM